MKRALVFASIVVTAAAGLAVIPQPAQAGGVNIGINIGPPPPIVVASPPQFVVVPDTPVSYAPGVGADLFVYGGRYYRYYDDAWFTAPAYGGPWTFVAFERVPPPVLAVPASYYRVPPGHLRYGGERWAEERREQERRWAHERREQERQWEHERRDHERRWEHERRSDRD